MGSRIPLSATTRRAFLGTAAGAAGALLLAGCEDPIPSDRGFKPQPGSATAAPPQDPVKGLNAALAIEHQAIFAYTAVAPLLSSGTAALAASFRHDHETHRDALSAHITSLGGAPVPAQPSYDLGTKPASETDALKAAADLEETAAKAYFKLTTTIEDPAQVQFLASIMGDEAQHAAILRAATGSSPLPAPFQGA